MHVVGVCLARLLDAKSLGTLISERFVRELAVGLFRPDAILFSRAVS